MTDPLPAPVARFIDNRNARDFDAAAGAFLPDAVVRDEGGEHRGEGAIRAWMRETVARYDDRAAVAEWRRDGDAATVLADVSGAFPGSPARLRFAFVLKDDRIARLEIGA